MQINVTSRPLGKLKQGKGKNSPSYKVKLKAYA